MGDLQQRDDRRVELVGKRDITGRRKYADLLYCIPQRNRCRGCEITDSGGILRGVRKNLGAIVFDFSDGSGMGNMVIYNKKGSDKNNPPCSVCTAGGYFLYGKYILKIGIVF